MTYQQTIASTSYKEALQATENIESPSIGFLRPAEVSGGIPKALTGIIKQNNSIIQLLVKNQELLVDCSDKLDNLSSRLRQQRDSELESQFVALSEQLKTASFGEKLPSQPKMKGPFYVFKDPLKIYEEEKAKLKQQQP